MPKTPITPSMSLDLGAIRPRIIDAIDKALTPRPAIKARWESLHHFGAASLKGPTFSTQQLDTANAPAPTHGAFSIGIGSGVHQIVAIGPATPGELAMMPERKPEEEYVVVRSVLVRPDVSPALALADVGSFDTLAKLPPHESKDTREFTALLAEQPTRVVRAFMIAFPGDVYDAMAGLSMLAWLMTADWMGSESLIGGSGQKEVLDAMETDSVVRGIRLAASIQRGIDTGGVGTALHHVLRSHLIEYAAQEAVSRGVVVAGVADMTDSEDDDSEDDSDDTGGTAPMFGMTAPSPLTS